MVVTFLQGSWDEMCDSWSSQETFKKLNLFVKSHEIVYKYNQLSTCKWLQLERDDFWFCQTWEIQWRELSLLAKENSLPFYYFEGDVLNTPRSADREEETMAEIREKNKWDNDDYICMRHILNGMSNKLFDTYQNFGLAKKLWEKLEVRYMTDWGRNQ